MDSEIQSLQLLTIHGTYSSVTEQSSNTSFSDPAFFKPASKIFKFSLPPETSVKFDTRLNYQKKILF